MRKDPHMYSRFPTLKRQILLIEIKGEIDKTSMSKFHDFCYLGPVIDGILHVVPKMEAWKLISYMMLNNISIDNVYMLDIDKLSVYKVAHRGVALPKSQYLGIDPIVNTTYYEVFLNDTSDLQYIMTMIQSYAIKIKIKKGTRIVVFIYLSANPQLRISLVKMFRTKHFLSILSNKGKVRILVKARVSNVGLNRTLKSFLSFPLVLR